MTAADTDTVVMNTLASGTLLEQMTAELESALYFKDRSLTSLEFVVGDQDGDGAPETIRYAWSGVNGDPLTRTFNAQPAETVAADVYKFMLGYTVQATSDPIRVMLLMGNATTPSSQDAAKQAALESFGFDVTPVDDGDSQAKYDDVISQVEVAYISEEVYQNGNGVAQKLVDASIGILNEEVAANDDLLTASSSGGNLTATSIDITDNSHYITQSFGIGALTICGSTSLNKMNGTLAGGLVKLADANVSSSPALGVIDYNGALYGVGKAAGRRVVLPFGGDSFDFNQLNANGLTIVQRSVEWAAGGFELTGVSIALQVGSDTAAKVEGRAEILNRTRVTGP